MQVQRVAGRIEDHAAIDDAQGVIHAKPKAFEHLGRACLLVADAAL